MPPASAITTPSWTPSIGPKHQQQQTKWPTSAALFPQPWASATTVQQHAFFNAGPPPYQPNTWLVTQHFNYSDQPTTLSEAFSIMSL